MKVDQYVTRGGVVVQRRVEELSGAGARLGELAVREPGRLQALLMDPASAASLLPDLTDLPEFLTEAEFTRRYGGADAPAYREQLPEIEGRVAGLPLFR